MAIAISNAEVAERLREMALFLDMRGVAFKPRAYELASESVLALGDEVENAWRTGGVDALKKLPALGERIATKIDEYFRTGKIKEYEKMKKELQNTFTNAILKKSENK